MSGPRQIIAGVSGSPGNVAALRYAGDMARLKGARLLAVHAWVPPGGDLADRRAPSLEMRRIWRKAAEDLLQEALAAAWGGAPAGLDVEPLVVRGEPGAVLVDVAWCTDDLLVVGAGRRGLARCWRGGRVSRYCLAHAGCPVLAVPPPALAREVGHGLRSWSWRHRELTVAQALAEQGLPGAR